MSAYQVNEECLYNVLTIISNSYGFGEHYDKAIEVIKMAKDKPAELFDQLARLNIYALTERYNSRMADMVSELKFNEQAYTKAILNSQDQHPDQDHQDTTNIFLFILFVPLSKI